MSPLISLLHLNVKYRVCFSPSLIPRNVLNPDPQFKSKNKETVF